jgi:polysaccharide pyruvyl transferase WcaK-like protein
LLEEIVKRSRLCYVRDQITREYLSSCEIPAAVGCPTMNAIEPQSTGFGVLHVDALDNVGEANYEAMEAMANEVAKKTGRGFVSINNLIPSESESALAKVLQHYRNADLILAGRLHGIIIALAMGKKVLAVSGDYKIESFMKAAGLGDWVLGLDEVDQVPRRLLELSQQPSRDEFVAETRRANESIAAKVRALHG